MTGIREFFGNLRNNPIALVITVLILVLVAVGVFVLIVWLKKRNSKDSIERRKQLAKKQNFQELEEYRKHNIEEEAFSDGVWKEHVGIPKDSPDIDTAEKGEIRTQEGLEHLMKVMDHEQFNGQAISKTLKKNKPKLPIDEKLPKITAAVRQKNKDKADEVVSIMAKSAGKKNK